MRNVVNGGIAIDLAKMGQFYSQNGVKVGFQLGGTGRKIETWRNITKSLALIIHRDRTKAHGSDKGHFGDQNDLASFFQVAREAPRSEI